MRGNKDITIATTLKKFQTEDSVVVSSLTKNRDVIHELHSMGVIEYPKNGRGRAKRGKNYESYVMRKFDGDIDLFLSCSSRAESLHRYGNDKIKNISPMSGLYLWSDIGFELIEGVTASTAEGFLNYIHESRLKEIELPKGAIVVGVENFEVITRAKSVLKNLSLPEGTIFVYRNRSFLDLIKEQANKIIYMPDYDVFGIRIFETEILPRRADTELYIPQDMESLIKKSKANNPKKHLQMYLEDREKKGSNYTPQTEDGKRIVDLINKHKCVIRQEYLI